METAHKMETAHFLGNGLAQLIDKLHGTDNFIHIFGSALAQAAHAVHMENADKPKFFAAISETALNITKFMEGADLW